MPRNDKNWNDTRVDPGLWHQVYQEYNERTSKFYYFTNHCWITSSLHLSVKNAASHQLSCRNGCRWVGQTHSCMCKHTGTYTQMLLFTKCGWHLEKLPPSPVDREEPGDLDRSNTVLMRSKITWTRWTDPCTVCENLSDVVYQVQLATRWWGFTAAGLHHVSPWPLLIPKAFPLSTASSDEPSLLVQRIHFHVGRNNVLVGGHYGRAPWYSRWWGHASCWCAFLQC